LTGVEGCAAAARAPRPGIASPAATEASRTWRLVNIASLPVFIRDLHVVSLPS
jgi:hypothetical protein